MHGADRAALLPEFGEFDGGVLAHDVERVAVDGALDRRHEGVFGDGEPSADHHKLWIEYVYEAGGRLSEDGADLLDAFDGEHVLVHQRLQDVIDVDVLRVGEL